MAATWKRESSTNQGPAKNYVVVGGTWFSTRIFRVFSFSEVPQIIVQERVDQAYDGGKPVWGKPAIVYASGSVASIGVIVFGIRKCGNVIDQHRDILSHKLIVFKVKKKPAAGYPLK